jgi:hypothetical protein
MINKATQDNRGQVAQSGRLGAADPVFDPGVGAVANLQVGELTALGVGEECGEAVPVGVGEAQLRARVRAFLAHDHPGRRPARPAGPRSR